MEAETTKKEPQDAVSAFADFIDTDFRDSYNMLNEGENYSSADLENAILGLYMYDVDTDDVEELAVVRAGQDGFFLDLYEFASGKVQNTDSEKLILDSTDDVVFSSDLSALSHMASRMTIFPKGSERFLCLTVEQQDKTGDYNAYTLVYEYAKQKITLKKSFRLRRVPDSVTLMCLDNMTLLYWSGAAAADAEVSLAKYGDLDTAFKTEFEQIGLTAPETKMENGTLAQYKVTAVPSEQHVFECSMEEGALRIIENGFLQSFLIRH